MNLRTLRYIMTMFASTLALPAQAYSIYAAVGVANGLVGPEVELQSFQETDGQTAVTLLTSEYTDSFGYTAQAMSSVDLETGVLMVVSSTNVEISEQTGIFATGQTQFNDVLIFGGAPGTVTIRLTLVVAEVARLSGGFFGLSGRFPNELPWGDTGPGIPAVRTSPVIAVAPGDTVPIQANLTISVGGLGTAPGFANYTATLSVEVSEGVTWTSESGVLLGDAGNPHTDSDNDGVQDSQDNCVLVSNADQLDADGDGIGNECDADFNQDCIVNAADLGFLRAVFFSDNAVADLNGDGVVNAADLGKVKALFFLPPGPSGIANFCAP